MNDIHSCSPFCERPECVKARAAWTGKYDENGNAVEMEVKDAVSAEASTTPSDKWKLWKNADPELLEPWFFGAFGFALRDHQPMEFVPYRGQLGFFKVPDEFLSSTRTGTKE